MVANNKQDLEAALRYVKTLLTITPDSPDDRLYKAVLCYNTKRASEGLNEVDWIIENQPPGILMPRVIDLRDALQELPQ